MKRSRMSEGAVAVIGIGNPDRGDDAAGREVARRLRSLAPSGLSIIELEGEATAILAAFEGVDAAFIVDACDSGGLPGKVLRMDAADSNLPGVSFGLSSHGFGLHEALALARTLGMLPRRCVVYGIEAASFDIGAPVSATVELGVEETIERLRVEIASLACQGVNDA